MLHRKDQPCQKNKSSGIASAPGSARTVNPSLSQGSFQSTFAVLLEFRLGQFVVGDVDRAPSQLSGELERHSVISADRRARVLADVERPFRVHEAR